MNIDLYRDLNLPSSKRVRSDRFWRKTYKLRHKILNIYGENRIDRLVYREGRHIYGETEQISASMRLSNPGMRRD